MRVALAVTLCVLLLTAGCTIDSGPPTPTMSGTPEGAPPVSPSPTPGSPTPTASPEPTGPPTLTEYPSPVPAHTPTATAAASEPPSPTPTPTVAESQALTAEVIRVVDGDTLKIRYENGSEDTVRLLGVDTPEVHVEPTPDEWEGVPDSAAGKDCLRAAGHDASDYVTRELEGERVRLAFDANEGPRGYYGRLLAYVYLDGTHVNYQLVNRGLARVYESNFEKRSRFYAAEEEAQAQRRGAWDCRDAATATPPPSGETTENALALVEIQADAPGNDHENENGEYVVFENTGETTLDLTGWTVSDEADHTFTFPSGFSLSPGAQVTLYTGSGGDTQAELYWGSDAAIWNNGGDTVIVQDSEETTVFRYQY